MQLMFFSNYRLQTINLGDAFHTTKATGMNSMFSGWLV